MHGTNLKTRDKDLSHQGAYSVFRKDEGKDKEKKKLLNRMLECGRHNGKEKGTKKWGDKL